MKLEEFKSLEQNVFSSAQLDFKNKQKILVFVYLLFFEECSKSKQQNRIYIFFRGGLLQCLKISLKLCPVNFLPVTTLKNNESLYIYYLINKK